MTEINKIYEIENIIWWNLWDKDLIVYDKELIKLYTLLKNLWYKNIERIKDLGIKDDKVKEVLSILYWYSNEKVVKNIDELKEIMEDKHFTYNNNNNNDF